MDNIIVRSSLFSGIDSNPQYGSELVSALHLKLVRRDILLANILFAFQIARTRPNFESARSSRENWNSLLSTPRMRRDFVYEKQYNKW